MADFPTGIVPKYSMVLDEAPKILRAQFGDGYSQRTPDGINYNLKSYNTVFELNSTQLSTLLTFLRAQAGYLNFNWTPPGGVSGKYICAKWSTNYEDYGTSVVTCTMEEVAEV